MAQPVVNGLESASKEPRRLSLVATCQFKRLDNLRPLDLSQGLKLLAIHFYQSGSKSMLEVSAAVLFAAKP